MPATPTPIPLPQAPVGRVDAVRKCVAQTPCGDTEKALYEGAKTVVDVILGDATIPNLNGYERETLSHVHGLGSEGDHLKPNPQYPVGTLRLWIEGDHSLKAGYRETLAKLWETVATHAAQRRISDRVPAVTAGVERKVDAALKAQMPVGPTGLASIPKDIQNAIARAIRAARTDGGMLLSGAAMATTITRAGGVDRSAHGLAKGGELAFLETLLTTGVNRTERFSEAPLWVPDEWRAAMGPAMGTGGGTAYSDGPFIVVAPPGKSVKDGGVDAVLVNDEIADVALPALRAAYPGTRFLRFSQAPDLKGVARPSGKK